MGWVRSWVRIPPLRPLSQKVQIAVSPEALPTLGVLLQSGESPYGSSPRKCFQLAKNGMLKSPALHGVYTVVGYFNLTHRRFDFSYLRERKVDDIISTIYT